MLASKLPASFAEQVDHDRVKVGPLLSWIRSDASLA